MTDRIDELLGRRVDLRALALLRVPVGLLALVHLWPFLDDAFAGHIYRDAYTEPYASWYPELSRGAYTALLAAGVAGAALMTVGLLTRLATAVTFGVVAYNLFLSTTHVHNNRAYLTIILAAARGLWLRLRSARRGRCGCCGSRRRSSTAPRA
jgi:hypothetical protein